MGIDLSAGKIVALIGAFVAICVGILYLKAVPGSVSVTQALYILAGITSLAGGIIVLLIVEVLGFKIPIPYNWWILLIIGGVIILMDLLLEFVGGVTDQDWMYLGGSLIGLAGLIELLISGGKLSWAASKFVLLVGASMAVVLSIIFWDLVWSIIAIALCVILILMLFDVIPNKWWAILGIGIAVLILFVHLTAGGVLLVGFALMLMDK